MYGQLRSIEKVRLVLNFIDTETIIYFITFISSRLDYCIALFTCVSLKTLQRLQVDQNAFDKNQKLAP